MAKKIPTVSHNVELAEEFKKQFTCLGENAEKYITFTVSIKTEVRRIDKIEEKITKSISYILQFIDSARFMSISLSNFVNILPESVHRTKCKFTHDDKKCQVCGNKYNYCNCFFDYVIFKDDLVEYKCFCCNKNYQHNFDQNLNKQFFTTYTFSNQNNIKSILLLPKGIYHYEYMDGCEKFN